jgi:hypothetical protein
VPSDGQPVGDGHHGLLNSQKHVVVPQLGVHGRFGACFVVSPALVMTLLGFRHFCKNLYTLNIF